MKNKKIIRPIISIAMLSITALLLITTMFSWYSTNNEASVSGVTGSTLGEMETMIITFNTNNDKADVTLIPGGIAALKVNVTAEKATSAKLQFKEPIIGWKDIVTEYTKLSKGVEFKSGMYYSKNEDTYTLLETKPAGFDTDSSQYYSVSDTVVTQINQGTDSLNLDFKKLYGVNSYFKGTLADELMSYKKSLMTMGKKRDTFLKLYKNDDIDMSSKITVFVSSEEIEPEEYGEKIVPKIGTDEFYSISNTEIQYTALTPSGESMYFYFYFDPTDEYFNSGDEDDDIYFYGQNPYFLQTCTLNLFIA